MCPYNCDNGQTRFLVYGTPLLAGFQVVLAGVPIFCGDKSLGLYYFMKIFVISLKCFWQNRINTAIETPRCHFFDVDHHLRLVAKYV